MCYTFLRMTTRVKLLPWKVLIQVCFRADVMRSVEIYAPRSPLG
jgi:hypothetical protein